jgi:hypothetical protein
MMILHVASAFDLMARWMVLLFDLELMTRLMFFHVVSTFELMTRLLLEVCGLVFGGFSTLLSMLYPEPNLSTEANTVCTPQATRGTLSCASSATAGATLDGDLPRPQRERLSRL